MRCVVFDLDGVLVDTRAMHVEALNAALRELAPTCSVHGAEYEARPTRVKLQMLTERQGLRAELHDAIWARKQELSADAIRRTVRPDPAKRRMLLRLRALGFRLGCASNCVRRSMYSILAQLDLIDCFDALVSQEDVAHPKPAPDVYRHMAAQLRCDEGLVVEDSDIGAQAASALRWPILRVAGPADVTLARVLGELDVPYTNVVIPMAGRGSRFAAAGYTMPKPLVPVLGRPMIEAVVDNLRGVPNPHFIFIVHPDHRRDHALDALLRTIAPHCDIVEDGSLGGGACAVWAARDCIDRELPLLTANSDQLVEWDPAAFLAAAADGAILTFTASDAKWSYAEVTPDNRVTRVAEKVVISSHATVGVYYWRRGAMCLNAIAQMMAKNIRTNNEFYLCPAFNECVQVGLDIRTHDCARMWGLGTPEDLQAYLAVQALQALPFIAHRGNTQGPDPATENDPAHVARVHDALQCDVEVDVWWVDDQWLLGHDAPQHPVTLEFLRAEYLWRHAKNLEALRRLRALGLRCFWHQTDAYTLTSAGDIWVFPDQPLCAGAVAVMPERAKYDAAALQACGAVCSDYADPARWIKM